MTEKIHTLRRSRLICDASIQKRWDRPKSINRQGVDATKEQMIWMKAMGQLPPDLSIHQSVAAYCSDHYLLYTTLQGHDVSPINGLKMIASLDHAIVSCLEYSKKQWFHEPFRSDEWLLYEMESTRAIGGRGLVYGRIFTRDGRLVASTAQEGVIRVNDRAKL